MRGDRGNVWRGGDYEVLGLYGGREGAQVRIAGVWEGLSVLLH